MFLYEAFLYLHDAVSHGVLFYLAHRNHGKHRILQVAMPLLASGPSTLNDISHSLILSHANLATFRSLAKGKSKSRRERITSLALVGLAECFQPDSYIQAIAMYASAKVCVVL